MKRKIRNTALVAFCIALAAVMLVQFNATVGVEASERAVVASGTNMKVNWTLYDDGELCIEGTGFWNTTPWKQYYAEVERISIGKDVTCKSICNFYFDVAEGYVNLEEVSVAEGNTAFYADESGVLYNYDKTKLFLFPAASEITEYTIPDSVETIVKGAFCGAKNINSVVCGKGLKTISANAFYCSSGLENITFEQGLESVGTRAFFNCTSLESIALPDSVTALGSHAFSGCESLREASTGNGVKNILSRAFLQCTSLENISFGNSVEYIGECTFEQCVALKEIDLPESITSIGRGAFIRCESLESVVIPDGISVLMADLLKNCSGLKSVTIPASVTQTGSDIFTGCDSITDVYYKGDAKGWCSIDFHNNSNPVKTADNLYINGELVTDFEIPEGITEVSDYLFVGYARLESITLNDSVKSIGISAFADCINLKSIDIPDSVVTIGNDAFLRCTALTDITVSENIEYIGEGAFVYSGYAKDFANWDNGFLYLGSYLLDVDPDEVKGECKLYEKTKLVASGAFQTCHGITKVIVPDGVRYINDKGFYNCGSLSSVRLPEGLDKISSEAFGSCKSLKDIVIPSTVTAVEDNAFVGCSALEKLTVPAAVKVIGDRAFYNCTSLNELVISDGIEEIGRDAFALTTSLKEIYLPSTLISLNGEAFNKSGVTDIYYGATKAEWKRLAQNSDFSAITVHYTLRSEDEAVIINHTDKDFDYESGNVHLKVTEMGKANSTYDQNGFYNRLLVDPVQILDISLVDGDGNAIQPLADGRITVKLRASEEFMKLVESGLALTGEYEVKAQDIDFINDCFVFEKDGETVKVPAPQSFLTSFKIIHWFSDAVNPWDFEAFTHDEISIENGYIILHTNHFSEYAVCINEIEFKNSEIEIMNGSECVLEVTVAEGFDVIFSSSDESVLTVDETGKVTAKKSGVAYVTAGFADTDISSSCKITVLPRSFTVTWAVDGAETQQTVKEEADIELPSDPEKEGYIFKGWTPAVDEKMPSYDVTYTAVFEKVTATDIEIESLPAKTSYTYKTEKLDLSGIKIKVNYSDGSSQLVTDPAVITAEGFDAKSTGSQKITVSCEGCTAQFEVKVSYTWWQQLIRIFLLGIFWY